jgi:hypothetical protein
MSGLSVGAKKVAPPVPPRRTSFTMFLVSTDRSDSWLVQRYESWSEWTGKSGNVAW